MSRPRRKRKRAEERGDGRDKPTPPAPLGSDTAPTVSSDDAVAEAAAIPPEIAEKLVQFTGQSFEFSVGPLPHPQLYGEYEHVLPGAADRITKMAEKAQGHRHRQQSTRLDADVSLELRGQWMGFLVVAVALIGGMILIAFDKTLEGATAAVGAIGGVAGLFLWSRRRKPRGTIDVPVPHDRHRAPE